jgi:hypothetical protein
MPAGENESFRLGATMRAQPDDAARAAVGCRRPFILVVSRRGIGRVRRSSAMTGFIIASAVVLSACTPGHSGPSRAGKASSSPAGASASSILDREARTGDARVAGGLATEVRMRAHVTAADALRAAVVRGDMEAFRGAAADLTGDDATGEVWDVNLDVLRTAARHARDAGDPTRGAETLASIGDACSHCHVMLGPPKVPIPAEPSSVAGTRSRMRRHAWAARSLWIGLTTPSAEAWRRGALATPDQRRAAFAEVMSACAPCHAAMGVMSP